MDVKRRLCRQRGQHRRHAGEQQRRNAYLEAVAACSGVVWRATVDEDGRYCFAMALWCGSLRHAAVAENATACDSALCFITTIAARALSHGAVPRRLTAMAEVPQ